MQTVHFLQNTSPQIAWPLRYAEGHTRGVDLVEDASAAGGVFVNDEDIALAADMDVVAEDHFRCRQAFYGALLTIVSTAHADGDEPLEAIRLWLDAHLQEEAA